MRDGGRLHTACRKFTGDIATMSLLWQAEAGPTAGDKRLTDVM